MQETLLVTGNKYDKVVRFILIVTFILAASGLVLSFVRVSGQTESNKAAQTSVAVSGVTGETISESDLDERLYLVLSRPNGSYAFMKIQNAVIKDEKFAGYPELIYQNGEARLTPEVNGKMSIYDSSNRVVETDDIVFRGVMEITLPDSTTVPVRLAEGRISGGKLVGKVRLINLNDNSEISGTFDSRGNFVDVVVTSSLVAVNSASVAVAKGMLSSLEVATIRPITTFSASETTTATPRTISGAVTVDPITGLAIINSGVIGDTQIANGSITLLKIADGAVSTAKLGDSSVTGTKIADGAVGTSQLGDSSVTDAKLAQITSSNKVAGSAVELKSGGGLTHGSGLTLKTDCSTDQVLAWDGDSWECQSVGGVGSGISSINNLTGALTVAGGGLNTVSAIGSTITVTGTLPSIGAAGTYGSSTSIPVLTTDANGRVSGVTNTTISGLSSSNLAATAGITNAQLANSSIYVSPGSGISVSGSPVSLGGTLTIAGVDASTTTKGVASFNSTNFSVVSGAVNTIQNIDTTAEPSFHALTLSHTTNQLVLGSTNTTTISSTAPSANRTATIPALTASDEFVFKNQNQTLTSKTLDAGSNTITGLTNSNLSGTAAIADSNLAQLTTTNKVAGSAVQLNANGGIANATGLSLLRTCSDNQILKWTAAGGWACAADSTGGTPSVYTDGGLLSDGTGLSLLRTCSDSQILKWTSATGWTCQADNTGGGSVTVAETDGSPSVGSVTTLQFGPTSVSSDEFVITDQGGGVARIRTGNKVVLTDSSVSLTNKTIDGTLNTLQNIVDSSLSTISTANKVSGSAVQLSANGGLTNISGLSLLSTCLADEILKWNGSAWVCSSSGTSLNAITTAVGASTIANGDYAQTWNWGLTTASKTAFTFGETSAATNGAGSQYILNVRTLSSSTAAPLGVFARTYPVIDTTAAGGVTIGNATLAQGITIDSGAGAINIGNGATGKTITIGNQTGTGALNMYAGTGNFILDGASGTTYTIGTSTTTGTFTIGGMAETGTANVFTGSGGMILNLGTGGASVYLGNTTSSTATTINSGTGGLTLLTGTSGNLSLKTGTTGTVTLDSGTTGAVNIGTGANAKTVTLGSSDTTSTTYVNSGTGGITLLTGTSGVLSLKTGTTGAVTLDSGTIGDVNIGTGISGAGKNIYVGNMNGTSALTLASGTGGINIGTADILKTINIGTGGSTNAQTINIGSTNGTSTTNIKAGSGGILFTVDGTGSSGQVRIGNSGTATPDLLVLDNGTADPTGINGGMYYSTAAKKFRCYENGAWKDCDTGVSNIKTSNTTATFSFSTTESSLISVTITPTSTSKNVWITTDVLANNFTTNAAYTFRVRRGNTCDANSAQVGTDEVGGNTGQRNYPVTAVFNLVDSPASASATTYQLCVVSSSNVNNVANVGRQITVVEGTLGADLAEVYNSTEGFIDQGSVVSVDGTIDGGARKSTKAYDSTVLGVISTNPGMVLSGSAGAGTPVLVALSGRVPVKVSNENGNIAVGDYLTSSSIPGVAMKATKAGAIIGTAMTGYAGDDVGEVVVFVKNGVSNGAKLAEVMSGLDVSSDAYSSDVLTNLLQAKDQIASSAADISEIFTDRVTAGVEVITPKVTTQDILVQRDATISGILYADTIKANRIEGMEILTKKLSLLTEEVAGIATDSAKPEETAKQAETNIFEVIGQRIAEVFKNAVEFFGRVIFHSDVAFLGRPTFNKDTAGFATILAGGSEVEVVFEREYATEPVVTATVQITGGASVTDIPGYAIADVNTKGFKIRLSQPAGMDIRFAWVALAVSNTKSFQGSGGMLSTPMPSVVVTENREMEVVPTPIVENVPVATSEATPTVTVTPSDVSIEETVNPFEEASISASL